MVKCCTKLVSLYRASIVFNRSIMQAKIWSENILESLWNKSTSFWAFKGDDFGSFLIIFEVISTCFFLLILEKFFLVSLLLLSLDVRGFPVDVCFWFYVWILLNLLIRQFAHFYSSIIILLLKTGCKIAKIYVYRFHGACVSETAAFRYILAIANICSRSWHVLVYRYIFLSEFDY